MYVTGYDKRVEFAHFPNFMFINSENIAAMDLLFTSSCYTHKEYSATPTSGLGGVSMCQLCLKIIVLCLTLVAHAFKFDDL